MSVPASDADGSFSVSWSSAGGATSYTLKRQTNSGAWTTVYTGSATSHAEPSLPGARYRYAVQACSSIGCSADTLSGTVAVPPRTPTGLSTSVTQTTTGSATLSWNSSFGASRYELQRQHNNGSWSNVYSGSGFSAAQSELTDGAWDYRVRACADWGCSGYSGEVRVTVETPPPMPSSISSPLTDLDGGYTVSWSAVSGIDHYTLQESTLTGSGWSAYANVYSGTSTSKSLIRSDGTYRYRVQACKTFACSDWRGPSTTEVGYGGGTCSTSANSEPDAGSTESTAASEPLPDDGSEAQLAPPPGC